jgi:hypothetical protein
MLLISYVFWGFQILIFLIAWFIKIVLIFSNIILVWIFKKLLLFDCRLLCRLLDWYLERVFIFKNILLNLLLFNEIWNVRLFLYYRSLGIKIPMIDHRFLVVVELIVFLRITLVVGLLLILILTIIIILSFYWIANILANQGFFVGIFQLR